MDKKNLVLLPALMCDERLYQHQIATLEEFCNIRVFTFKDVDNIKDAAQNILYEMVGSKFLLAGTSMGGYIAMEIMKIAPKTVEKLCFINTTFYEDSFEKKPKDILK